MTPFPPRIPYSVSSAGSFSALMDSMSSGWMPMSTPPGPGVYGIPLSRNNGSEVPSGTFSGGFGFRSVLPAGWNEVAPNEFGGVRRATRIPPLAVVWIKTPDDLDWRSSLRVEELAMPLPLVGGCDGADAQPAAITSADTPSIPREKMHTMGHSG